MQQPRSCPDDFADHHLRLELIFGLDRCWWMNSRVNRRKTLAKVRLPRAPEMIKKNNTSMEEVDEGDQHRELKHKNNELNAEVR